MTPAFKKSFKRGLIRGAILAVILLSAMLAMGMLNGCGRAGEPEYPAGATYPKQHPSR